MQLGTLCLGDQGTVGRASAHPSPPHLLPSAKLKRAPSRPTPLPSLPSLFYAENGLLRNPAQGEVLERRPSPAPRFSAAKTSGLGGLATVLVSPIIITLQKNCLGCRLCSNQTYVLYSTHVPGEWMQPGRRHIPSNISPWQTHSHKVSSSRNLTAGELQPDIPNKGIGLVSHGD